MRRSLIVSLTVLALAACLGEEGEDHFIRASIYGGTWSAAASEGIVVFTPEQPDGPGILYSEATRAFGAGTRSWTLGLPTTPDTGLYTIDGVNVRTEFLQCAGPDLASCSAFRAVGGPGDSLRITRVDGAAGIIEGRFWFYGAPAGVDEVGAPVTGGSFRIHAPSVSILE